MWSKSALTLQWHSGSPRCTGWQTWWETRKREMPETTMLAPETLYASQHGYVEVLLTREKNTMVRMIEAPKP